MSDRPDYAVAGPAEHGLGVWGAVRPRGRRELVVLLASVGLVLLALVIALLNQGGAAPAGPAPAAPTHAATATAAPAAPVTPVAPPTAAHAAPALPAAPGAVATPGVPATPGPGRGEVGSGAAPRPQAGAPAGPSTPAQPETRTYQVRSGDTLATIALRHGVDYQQIAADNRLADPNLIGAGQRLRIGSPTPGVRVIQPGETLGGIAEATGLSLAQLLAQNSWISNPDRIPAGAGLRVHP